MNNRGTLGLKYAIWGQKIWNPSVDGVKPWTSWRTMEDRGDITANHWYVLTSNVDLDARNCSNAQGSGTMFMSASTKKQRARCPSCEPSLVCPVFDIGEVGWDNLHIIKHLALSYLEHHFCYPSTYFYCHMVQAGHLNTLQLLYVRFLLWVSRR